MWLNQRYLMGITDVFFTLLPYPSHTNPLDYLSILTHTLGHASWQHLISNLTFILLIGPILEEKYGSTLLFWMMVVTASVTGVVHILIYPDVGLIGGSGIAFMLILLSSFTNINSKHIPLTFILIFVLFLGRETLAAMAEDNVSQITHIAGGICGSIFGYLFGNTKRANNTAT